MEIMQWLTGSSLGEVVFTALVSMLPVIELRGGIPFGVGIGLPIWGAFLASVVGNLLPAPFIVVYIRRIFHWLRQRMPRFNALVDKLERKAHLKGSFVTKYRFWGLMLVVAIPLPGTGAWTGALVAALLGMRLREALPAIVVGVLVAGVLVSGITFGFSAFLL